MSEVKLKLCGNRSMNDLQKTTNSLAHYIGVIFAESKRKVNPKQLKKWLSSVPLQEEQQLVGIFVNPKVAEIEAVLSEVHLDILQVHGDETVGELLHFKEHFDLPIWKAIHHSEDALKKMKSYQGIVNGYVVDVKIEGQWGGTGQAFDWTHIPNYLAEARRQHVPCFIAGGIDPTNVGDVLKFHPDGIDLASGIETDEKKDEQKIIALEERLIQHGQSLSE